MTPKLEGYKPKVGGDRKKIVQELKQMLKEYPIVAAVNLQNLPSLQLSRIRATIRDKMGLIMTKKRLMVLALADAEKETPGISKLTDYLVGMPALLFTKENPFILFKTLQSNKSNAPAKAGQVAPSDIWVEEGPTSFAPGPIIGELGAIGIKSSVVDGKIAIKERSLVVKEGDTITQKVAELLTRLGVEPMEVGLNLTAAFEAGDILERSVLDIDMDAYMDNLANCASQSFHLSVRLGILNQTTVIPIIQKAQRDAANLATEQGILTKENVPNVIGKAVAQAKMLQQITGGE